MNDSYLYRAKRIDNGKWEVGSLIILPDGRYEIGNVCTNPPDSDPMFKKAIITHDIDPSTICRCTGKKDVPSGKLIFEHDIVSFLDTYSTESGYAEQWCEGEVLWDDEELLFYVTERLSAESFEVLDDCAIIGNTFDNLPPKSCEASHLWEF